MTETADAATPDSTLTKFRAAMALVVGMLLTWPAQLYLASIGSTELFVDDNAEYVLGTGEWFAFVVAALAIGLGAAFGYFMFITRRMGAGVRRRLRVRYIALLAALVLLSALALLDAAQTEEAGITPFVITVWIAGPAVGTWLLTRPARE